MLSLLGFFALALADQPIYLQVESTDSRTAGRLINSVDYGMNYHYAFIKNEDQAFGSNSTSKEIYSVSHDDHFQNETVILYMCQETQEAVQFLINPETEHRVHAEDNGYVTLNSRNDVFYACSPAPQSVFSVEVHETDPPTRCHPIKIHWSTQISF